MEGIFLKLFNMSITASWLALAVILFRLLLPRAPKWTRVLLWGFVALRLILPFNFESILSLVPSAEVVPPDIVVADTPHLQTGIDAVNEILNPIIMEQYRPIPEQSVNLIGSLVFILAVVWAIGAMLMLAYFVGSTLYLGYDLRFAVKVKENVYITEREGAPFIFGIIRPRIYLSRDLSDKERESVILHEMSHIKRRDHLWKPLGFLLLSVYWFNPILWVAYIMLCKDIELACDEKVLASLGEEGKREYFFALLSVGAHENASVMACPLAFGEVGLKSRVKNILRYKKPAVVIVALSLVVCIVIAVCFLTDPKDGTQGEDIYHRGTVVSGGIIYSVGSTARDVYFYVDKIENTGRISIKYENRGDSGVYIGGSVVLSSVENGDINTVLSVVASHNTYLGGNSIASQWYDITDMSPAYTDRTLRLDISVSDNSGASESDSGGYAVFRFSSDMQNEIAGFVYRVEEIPYVSNLSSETVKVGAHYSVSYEGEGLYHGEDLSDNLSLGYAHEISYKDMAIITEEWESFQRAEHERAAKAVKIYAFKSGIVQSGSYILISPDGNYYLYEGIPGQYITRVSRISKLYSIYESKGGYIPVYHTAEADIDNDGRKETVTVAQGISVVEGDFEYQTVFVCEYYEDSGRIKVTETFLNRENVSYYKDGSK